ncbi:MAG TPA: acylphosphatase, partial [Methanothrix sp.]|nr:acylphosphatase [Methanothrix sp.]
MKLKLKISGSKVHDVGYRAFLLEAAEDLGLTGFYARNMTEDSLPVVIACLEGDEAPLAEFQCIVRSQRPDRADVSDIVFSEHSGLVEDIGVFSSRFQARQLRKGISSIIRMEEKQDRML